MNKLPAKIRRKPRLYVVNTDPSWRNALGGVLFPIERARRNTLIQRDMRRNDIIDVSRIYY